MKYHIDLVVRYERIRFDEVDGSSRYFLVRDFRLMNQKHYEEEKNWNLAVFIRINAEEEASSAAFLFSSYF